MAFCCCLERRWAELCSPGVQSGTGCAVSCLPRRNEHWSTAAPLALQHNSLAADCLQSLGHRVSSLKSGFWGFSFSAPTSLNAPNFPGQNPKPTSEQNSTTPIERPQWKWAALQGSTSFQKLWYTQIFYTFRVLPTLYKASYCHICCNWAL